MDFDTKLRWDSVVLGRTPHMYRVTHRGERPSNEERIVRYTALGGGILTGDDVPIATYDGPPYSLVS